MRILFCGDRNWTDPTPIQRAFDRYEVTVCINGGARGADTLAAREAELRGIPTLTYMADWTQYGKAAGPIRNRQMLREGQPELVIAFHHDLASSKGTADMVVQARKAGIPVEVII